MTGQQSRQHKTQKPLSAQKQKPNNNATCIVDLTTETDPYAKEHSFFTSEQSNASIHLELDGGPRDQDNETMIVHGT